MKNEAVFEGIVSETPTLFTTEKHFKIVTVILEQEEVYATGDSKIIKVPFKAFGKKAEELLKVKAGDLVGIKGKLTGSSFCDKNNKVWFRSENTVKDFQVQKIAATSKTETTITPSMAEELDNIPF